MCFETTHELLSGPTIRTAGRARHGRGISGALRAATRRSAERYPGARVRLRAGARGPPRDWWRGRGADPRGRRSSPRDARSPVKLAVRQARGCDRSREVDDRRRRARKTRDRYRAAIRPYQGPPEGLLGAPKDATRRARAFPTGRRPSCAPVNNGGRSQQSVVVVSPRQLRCLYA